VSEKAIASALSQFEGIGRRFQLYGEVPIRDGNVTMIDDYGHHPREIAATIEAAREAYPQRRLVLVFQPHRYSRTRDLFEDFTQVLSKTDVLLVTEVYAAGESPITGADGRTLCRAIRARGHVDPIFVDTVDDLAKTLLDLLQDKDVLLTCGAGSIGAAAAKLPEELAEAIA
jgi:UDP-N-acetylmuramate--alanine ligase